MKTFFTNPAGQAPLGLLLGLLAFGASNAAQAQFITGDIQFNGGATLNGPLATATAFSSIFGPGSSLSPAVLPGGETGDYAGIPGGTSANFNTFSFNPSSPTPFLLWSLTYNSTVYDFYASSVTIVLQNDNFLDITGNGTAQITGFSDTQGTWQVTDTGVGNVPVFTFGAATDASGNPAPEPSTSAMLLMFLPIAGLAFWARSKTQKLARETITK